MTKRHVICIAVLTLLLALTCGALASARAEGGDAASWTVLIYMCGSDLESEGGLASANLEEISRTSPFPDISPADVPRDSAVNLLIETGGCLQWQTGSRLGFDVAADKLQRYRYDPGLAQPFVLEREEPIARMSDPETLADFIRWGAREYPHQARHRQQQWQRLRQEEGHREDHGQDGQRQGNHRKNQGQVTTG